MLRFRPNRTSYPWSCPCVVIVIVAFCGLMARYVPPTFAGSTARPAFQVQAGSDHRPYFDSEDLQWPASPTAVVLNPLPKSAASPLPEVERLIEITTNGWHFNRPP